MLERAMSAGRIGEIVTGRRRSARVASGPDRVGEPRALDLTRPAAPEASRPVPEPSDRFGVGAMCDADAWQLRLALPRSGRRFREARSYGSSRCSKAAALDSRVIEQWKIAPGHRSAYADRRNRYTGRPGQNSLRWSHSARKGSAIPYTPPSRATSSSLTSASSARWTLEGPGSPCRRR